MGHTMTHSPREARREATKPTGAVEVAPGIYAVDPEHIGRTVLARFTPSGRPGQYVLRAVGGHYAALDRELLELLGLPGRYNLLHRLGEQGYIRLLPISERTWMLDVDSYIQHLNAVRTAVDEGKDFWTSSRKHAFDGRRADLAPSDERADELRDQAVQVQELLEDEAFLNAWAEHIRRVEQKTGESFKPAHKRRALARLAALGGIEAAIRELQSVAARDGIAVRKVDAGAPEPAQEEAPEDVAAAQHAKLREEYAEMLAEAEDDAERRRPLASARGLLPPAMYDELARAVAGRKAS